ncbi:hypothetical protein GCM10007392_01870 [Saccharospirillum salsuginis]|uniref:Uncharacterized protein n=1 Tax=Saccharospirillum salsuginis TaxID=418750 RepID=A0A918K0V4_9GAMM|nr:hypothetical protein GCM10007392_01870 [Saccharospirillum salsuginis]
MGGTPRDPGWESPATGADLKHPIELSQINPLALNQTNRRPDND